MTGPWKPKHNHRVPPTPQRERLESMIAWGLLLSAPVFLIAGATKSVVVTAIAIALIAPFGIACLSGVSGRALHLLRGGG